MIYQLVLEQEHGIDQNLTAVTPHVLFVIDAMSIKMRGESVLLLVLDLMRSFKSNIVLFD